MSVTMSDDEFGRLHDALELAVASFNDPTPEGIGTVLRAEREAWKIVHDIQDSRAQD